MIGARGGCIVGLVVELIFTVSQLGATGPVLHTLLSAFVVMIHSLNSGQG